MRLLVSRAARPGRALQVLTLSLALGACSNDATAPEPLAPVTATLTADASATTAFVALGTQPRVAASCDQLISLPMDGQIGSLNVSTAAAALLYGVRLLRDGRDLASRPHP